MSQPSPLRSTTKKWKTIHSESVGRTPANELHNSPQLTLLLFYEIKSKSAVEKTKPHFQSVLEFDEIFFAQKVCAKQ